MSIGQNPLGKIMNIVGTLSLEVTYAYEDLVFIENNAFLFRFDPTDSNKVYLHFNEECSAQSVPDLEYRLKQSGLKEKVEILTREKYKLLEGASEGEFQILFAP